MSDCRGLCNSLNRCLLRGNANAPVSVADTTPVNFDDNILKGRGTAERDGEVVATLCGVVERVNKIFYVRPIRSRYNLEIGDIIVGRVVEVAPTRWKLEINFSQDAILMLSSMNLADGIQWLRWRTALDELNMRSFFEEDDVAEVRNFQHDGSLQLQARSQKYGKVGEHVEVRDTVIEDQVSNTEQQNTKSSINHMDLEQGQGSPLETRQNIVRVANSGRVFSSLGFNISVEVILDTVDLSCTMNLDVHEMIGSEFYVLDF